MRKILLAALALTATMAARAQTFTNVISSSGIPVDRSTVYGVFDYNQDGLEDLLMVPGLNQNGSRILKLYKNGGSGSFSDVTSQSSIPEIDSLWWVFAADMNNDGFQDFTTIEAGSRIRVMCGSATGSFSDQTSSSGFSMSQVQQPLIIRTADVNKDGKMDIAFTRQTATANEIVYLKNEFGTGATSTMITLVSFPLNQVPNFQFFDYDQDRDLDLFMIPQSTTIPFPGGGYYYHDTKTYQNNNGVFTEVPTISPIKFAGDGFHPYITDFNQDGKFDLMAGKPDFASNSSLFLPVIKNNGAGIFTDASTSLGFSSGSCYQYPPTEADFDNDGDLDYFNTSWGFGGCNGSLFFRNDNGVFSEQGAALGARLRTGANFNGANRVPNANFFDFDNDGDLDFFGSIDDGNPQTAFFMKNNSPSSNKWLKIKLNGCQSGKDGFYAEIMAKAGNSRFYRINQPTPAWYNITIPQSQLIHFGLGNAGIIDSLVVKWPSGQTTVLTNVAVNQTLTVNEDNSCNAVSTNCPDLSGSLLQGLVGYWPFCGNANDESGNGNNGTVNGATLTTDRFGNAGKAYSFDGVDDFIELPPVLPAQNQSYTVNFWAYVIPDSGRVESYTVFDDRNQSSFNSKGRFLIFGSNPRKYWYQMGDNPQCTGSDTPPELWVNFTCIYDNEKDSLFVYKNGVLDSSTYNPDASFFPGLRKLWIGKGQSPAFNSVEEWRGMIDDFGVWNRILSQSEITQLYYQNICRQIITVTDTLLIHTTITSWNPVTYANTVKVWPNPAEGATAITIDAGNLALMQGWKFRVTNIQGQAVPNLGDVMFNQQQQTLDFSNWGGYGTYFLYLLDAQNNIQEVKKIVLAP